MAELIIMTTLPPNKKIKINSEKQSKQMETREHSRRMHAVHLEAMFQLPSLDVAPRGS